VKAVDRAAPASPPGLHVVATSERQVAVSWGAATDDVGVATYEVLRGGAVVARLGGTAVTESGLAPAQAYCYVVRAVDASGNASDPAGPVCATTPDLTPPSAPDLLVVEAAGEHAVKARWAPAADDVGVEGYEVVRAGAVTATTAELAAALTGLRPLVEVCLSVRAFDAAGNRSPESRPGCASPPDLTAPTAPRDVVLAAPSEQRMELRWAPSQDEVGVASYEVERGGKAVVTSDGPRASDAGGLTAGQEVCYTIRARDTVGNVSAPSRRACAVMPDLTAPSQPPRFAAAPSSPSNVAFAWDVSTDNVGVAAYELRRGGQVVARLDGNALRASAAGLAPSTNHCFELMAVDRAGNRSAPASACATTAEPGVPAGPTVVRGEAKAPTMVVLKWDSSPDPDVVYTVYWDNGKKIGATSATQYTVAGLRSGERRCYRVAAMDVAGKESPRTIETCVASTPGAAASAK
jgi:chitodextrinase